VFSLSKICIDFQWWFKVDPEMYQVAQTALATVTLKNEANGATLPYTPKVFFGGNGVSGPTFVDNAAYRKYVFDEFQARCLDMETAAAAHIAYQNDVPFLFFRSLSDLAGADQDGNVIGVFFSVAAENAFAVTRAFIEALYPDEEETTPAGEEMNSGAFQLTVWSTIMGSLSLIFVALYN
jgi:adenosylhomocysteine nucleosidase